MFMCGLFKIKVVFLHKIHWIKCKNEMLMKRAFPHHPFSSEKGTERTVLSWVIMPVEGQTKRVAWHLVEELWPSLEWAVVGLIQKPQGLNLVDWHRHWPHCYHTLKTTAASHKAPLQRVKYLVYKGLLSRTYSPFPYVAVEYLFMLISVVLINFSGD